MVPLGPNADTGYIVSVIDRQALMTQNALQEILFLQVVLSFFLKIVIGHGALVFLLYSVIVAHKGIKVFIKPDVRIHTHLNM